MTTWSTTRRAVHDHRARHKMFMTDTLVSLPLPPVQLALEAAHRTSCGIASAIPCFLRCPTPSPKNVLRASGGPSRWPHTS